MSGGLTLAGQLGAEQAWAGMVSKVCSGDPGGLGGSLQQPDEVAEVRHSTYQDGRWLSDDKKCLQGHMQETASLSEDVSCDRS